VTEGADLPVGNGGGVTAGVLRLVLATANPDKASEIAAIVDDTARGRIELVARPTDAEDVDETGETLEDNALLKARALLETTGMAAVADDTGLEVDALAGAPGVRSSRYSGEHASYADNVAKLLKALVDAGATDAAARRARFRTVAVACFPGGRVVSADGVVEGHIAPAPLGEAGFGYDPVFVPDGSERTFSEMSAAEKQSCSHRGRAFRALVVGLLAGP
jgi:XTP/dITP diphosphohydrolase